MFHTFAATKSPINPPEADVKGQRFGGPRRISTSNACVECRRRKIRCDGAQPCGQCQWYQHPEACTYSKPVQRVVPSRKLVDKLQSQVDQYASILARLYPGKEPEVLLSLPREELINIALTLPAPAASPLSTESLAPVPGATKNSDGADSLAALEQAPDQDPQTDEAIRHRDKVQGISDDVNGLSLSVDKPSSYVGASSITAALKVIFKTAPVARPFIAQTYTETALPSRSNTPPPQSREVDPSYIPPPDVGHKLIESYFSHIHVLMPMIDEDQFWHTWLYGEQRGSQWLALLNMVFALGCLSMSTAENEDHVAYFQRARRHLGLEILGSGNLLVLQALGLLGGYYLHWLNRPNEANCLMGAALRMATALGLHREYQDGRPPGSANGLGERSGTEVPAEIRRRTWWSLFCLDAWGSTTTGRPSLGRAGPGITVQSPRIPERLNDAQYLASLKLLPVIHNITFCKLATKIQDTLASHPMLKSEELFSLDAELVKWHDDLPPILRPVAERGQRNKRSNSTQPQGRAQSITPSSASATYKNPFDFSQPPAGDNGAWPAFLTTPRAIMHWRYQNLRMLMHRPFLLAASLRKTIYKNLNAEEKVAVSRCRILAGEAIADIDSTCQDELIAGWNAVWMMYQAVMVPLVSLFSYLSSSAARLSSASSSRSPAQGESGVAPTGSDEDVDKWRQQIELAVTFFDRMQLYSVAAKKSRDVVERLYEASKHVSVYNSQMTMLAQTGLSPAHGFEATAPASDAYKMEPSHHIQFAPYTGVQNQPISKGMWGLSPNGEAAMNCFWDDMMYDTFPGDMPDMVGVGTGLEQYEWYPTVGPGGEMNINTQGWDQWPQYDGLRR